MKTLVAPPRRSGCCVACYLTQPFQHSLDPDHYVAIEVDAISICQRPVEPRG
jgi:hypothetical protein